MRKRESGLAGEKDIEKTTGRKGHARRGNKRGGGRKAIVPEDEEEE